MSLAPRCDLTTIAALLLVTSLATIASLTAPAGASATPSSDAVAALNKVRARVGVPPVANDETLAAACTLHATWMRLNRVMSHGETPATPGFTALGNDAGLHSVLYEDPQFVPQTTPETIPWLRGAPRHLLQLLHPGLVRTGYGYDGIYSCMFTLSPSAQPDLVVHDRLLARGQVFTWPPDGATDVPPAEDTSHETPNPNEKLGLPASQITGPYLLVYGSGFGGISNCHALRIVSATLTDPGGANVPIRFWDDVKDDGEPTPGLCHMPSGAGYLVAEQPLAEGATYTATVEMLAADAPTGTRPRQHTWSFTTTGPPDSTKPAVRLVAASLAKRGTRTAFRYGFSVRDDSPTTCTAVVASRTTPCVIRGDALTIAGLRPGTPMTTTLTLVVRDSAGHRTRTVATARRR